MQLLTLPGVVIQHLTVFFFGMLSLLGIHVSTDETPDKNPRSKESKEPNSANHKEENGENLEQVREEYGTKPGSW